jgi:hypothetical protein
MSRLITVLVSSLLFYILFRFLGLTPGSHTGHACGFLYGIAHGFIAIPCLIVKLITQKQALFAAHNTGTFYWLGYILGLFFLGGVGFLGGSRD